MKLPKIGGLIRRRILVNYRVDPKIIQSLLPAKFLPKLHDGSAIAGICLIRLENIRPSGLPDFLGLASENAAHRVAVTWKDKSGKETEGVYIWRRDTDSTLNHFAGGWLFPGEHGRANFRVTDDGERIDLEMKSLRDGMTIQVRGKQRAELPEQSSFCNVSQASDFCKAGALGYSPVKRGNRFQGMRLKAQNWNVMPFELERAHSSFFDDKKIFPAGSVNFDCALVMREIPHEWESDVDLYL